MKTRNVRRRQWDQFQNRLIKLERRGYCVCSGGGFMRQWTRRLERHRSKLRARLSYNQLKWLREFARSVSVDLEVGYEAALAEAHHAFLGDRQPDFTGLLNLERTEPRVLD